MISIEYAILFRIVVCHDYYQTGKSQDFTVELTPATHSLIADFGLLARVADDGGWAIFAEVIRKIDDITGIQSVELARAIDQDALDALIFRFFIQLRNPYFYNFTDLDAYKTFQAGHNIFYLNNCQFYKRLNGLYLGFKDADVPTLPLDKLGVSNLFRSPVALITNQQYNFILRDASDQKITAQTLDIIFENFNGVENPNVVHFDSLDATHSFLVDLTKVNALNEGFYKVSCSIPNTKTYDILYVPEATTRLPFALAEIRNDATVKTEQKFMDSNGKLFVNNGQIVETVYRLQFISRKIQRRYIIENRTKRSYDFLDSSGNLKEDYQLVTVENTSQKVLKKAQSVDNKTTIVETEPEDFRQDASAHEFAKIETVNNSLTSTVVELQPILPKPSISALVRQELGGTFVEIPVFI